MSTGKRLAKRSILGTKVMVPGRDDRYHPGLIQAVKTSEDRPLPRYAVRLEDSLRTFEFLEQDLVGPGFKGVNEVQLREGQKVYVTHHQREMPGKVVRHDFDSQEVLITVDNTEEETILLHIDEVRLLESRKSARLVNSDTDFSKLADQGSNLSDRKSRGANKAFEVPRSDYVQIAGTRKRRTSEHIADDEEVLSECSAALLLMKLSCSPSAPSIQHPLGNGSLGPLPQSGPYMDLPSPDGSSSGASSFRSPTPSPPLSTSHTDEGIVKDLNTVKLVKKILYQCTFPGCHDQYDEQVDIEAHVRKEHLNRPVVVEEDERDHEEEFYYTEIEIAPVAKRNKPAQLSLEGSNFGSGWQKTPAVSIGLVDHLDMARPAHEDPTGISLLSPTGKNRKTFRYDAFNLSKSLPSNHGSISLPVTIAQSSARSPGKLIVISPPSRSPHSSGGSNASGVSGKSPSRRPRDGKKCRKVYGLEQRDLWCTQCKWKKACARFGANATEQQQNAASTSLILSSSVPAVKALKF